MSFQLQHFSIQKQGSIKGGDAKYTLNEDTGDIAYEANVTAGFLFITKTYHFAGSYKADLEMLKSHLETIASGQVKTIGPAVFTVVDVDKEQGCASVNLSLVGQPGQGRAVVHLDDEFLWIEKLNVSTEVSGVSMNLILVASDPVKRSESRFLSLCNKAQRFFHSF